MSLMIADHTEILYERNIKNVEIAGIVQVADNPAMQDVDLTGQDRAAVMSRVDFIREAMGIKSHAEFARMLGMTPQKWDHYHKLRQELGIEVGRRISRLFNVPLDWIYFGTAEMLLPRSLADALDDMRRVGQKRA